MRGIKASTYPLASVIALSAVTDERRIVGQAKADAYNKFGMTPADVYEAISKLTSADFYKTMPADRIPGLFQDVYKPMVTCVNFPKGIRAYCKVQIVNNSLVVIAFKVES